MSEQTLRLPLAVWICGDPSAGSCCASHVALIAATPAAAAQHGVLTKSEYRQLQLAQKRIKSLESSDARNFSTADAVCTHMRPVSRMIADVRSGCLDLIRLGGDYGKLNARATKCGIDPSSEAALLSCWCPPFRAITRTRNPFTEPSRWWTDWQRREASAARASL